MLRERIRRFKAATQQLFGVNVPLLYPDIEQHIKIIAEDGLKVIFASAGNPATRTGWLKERGITVVRVVANLKFALKGAQQARMPMRR